MLKVECRVEYFQEGEKVVALCPDLNLSSFGDTQQQARARFKEAVQLFLAGCEELGSLEEVLGESGFAEVPGEPGHWVSRTLVGQERVETALSLP